MFNIELCTKPFENLKPNEIDKIRSHIHRFDQNSVTALSGYSVSMNTDTQNWHSKNNTQAAERKNEIAKALESKNITIQPKNGTLENDNDITFYLSKEKGNYRSEISNFRPIKIDAKSTYSFDFKPVSLPKSLVLFQVRELHGSMKKLGGDRPSFSLHIQQNGMLVATTNTVNENAVTTESNTKTYQNENALLKKIELGQYHHVTIEIIMHRDYPSIKVSIDNEMIYQRNTDFGALDSMTFYNKLGVYVPQQRRTEGLNDSEVSFDNIKETHYQYTSPEITDENNICLTVLKNDNSLPDAIATFEANQNNLINGELSGIGKFLVIFATPSLISSPIF
ncbi:polysaccharide lyase [Yersinia canariae]|uniref:polysaccharide lyase n=1 Tax=Yersinia canariae TaxID=2607663 RepID=UPI001FE8409B|nr:polysaccharide lyase [Yersinia canariae]